VNGRAQTVLFLGAPLALVAALLFALATVNASGAVVGDARARQGVKHGKRDPAKRCRRRAVSWRYRCARPGAPTPPEVTAPPSPAPGAPPAQSILLAPPDPPPGEEVDPPAEEPAPPEGLLRWAPPPLVDPVTVALGNGPTETYLSPDQDYVIELPHQKKVGATTIVGGHNVVIIGGAVTIPAGTLPGEENDRERRAIYIKDATGTVHIEGVLIDGSGGSEFDGIDIDAPEATVQLENDRIVGVRGDYDTMHGDIVQPWGGVARLRIDRLTGSSDYQGLQLPEDLGPIGSAEISNVNLTATGSSLEGGYMLWLTKGSHTCISYPVSLTDVFVQPRSERALTESVWPSMYTRFGCHCTGSDTASWPALPVTGAVQQGAPPGGSYVPAGTVGVGYHSPGYLEPN
jgi:hypothetical protein